MAYTGMNPTDPLALPRTIDQAASLTELNPLPPPGRPLDGTADLHPARSALYPAIQHENTITLGGTITEGEIWTMTVTPVLTGHGVAVADGQTPIVLSVTVNATATATALGIQFVAAALAASTIATVAGVGASTRLAEILTMTEATGVLTTVGVNPGATYTIAMVPEAGGTAPVVVTVDALKANLRMGVWVARTGVIAADGRTPEIRPLEAGDTWADLWGVVADTGNRGEAIDSGLGYTFRAYRAGRTVPIMPKEGHFTLLSETTVTAYTNAWVRTTATGDEVAGATGDTPDYTQQVLTTTPTVVDATVYSGTVQVFDEGGLQVAASPFYYLSGAGALDTEIVTGITADLTGSAVDAFLTLSGTTTLILTLDDGHTAVILSTGVGVLATVETIPASNDHVQVVGAKFSRNMPTAGVASIDFSL